MQIKGSVRASHHPVLQLGDALAGVLALQQGLDSVCITLAGSNCQVTQPLGLLELGTVFVHLADVS